MRTVLDKSYGENQNTQVIFNNFFFFFENRALYEIMTKNMVEAEGLHMTSQYGAYELLAG